LPAKTAFFSACSSARLSPGTLIIAGDMRCQAITRHGIQCGRNATEGSDRCAAHRTDRQPLDATVLRRMEVVEKKIAELSAENAMLAKGLVELTVMIGGLINGPSEMRRLRENEEAN
jgi:hypothetical protein